MNNYILHLLLLSSLLVVTINCDTQYFYNLNDEDNQSFELNSNSLEYSHIPHENNVQGILNYSLGVRLPGDILAAVGAKNTTWPRLQNVSVTLQYPASGVGRQVTYVAIQVSQSSNLGQAYIVGGGLHQRSIAIRVEAYNTYYFNYTAQIFGV